MANKHVVNMHFKEEHMQPLQPFAMRHANEIQVSSESHDSSASQGRVVIRGEEVGTFPRNSKSDDPQYK